MDIPALSRLPEPALSLVEKLQTAAQQGYYAYRLVYDSFNIVKMLMYNCVFV